MSADAPLVASAGSTSPAPLSPASPGRPVVREAIFALAVVGLGVYATRRVIGAWELPLHLGLSLLLLLASLAILSDRRPLARHGLRWPPAARASHALTLLALPLGAALAWLTSQLSNRVETGWWLTLHGNPSLDLIPYFFGQHALYAALPEELLFRAYLQTRARAATGRGLRDPSRTGLAITLTGAAFFAFHLPYAEPRALLGVGAAGLLFGWLRERTGSLVAPIACHAAFNAMIAWMRVSHA